jgi:hypothetical protein
VQQTTPGRGDVRDHHGHDHERYQGDRICLQEQAGQQDQLGGSPSIRSTRQMVQTLDAERAANCPKPCGKYVGNIANERRLRTPGHGAVIAKSRLLDLTSSGLTTAVNHDVKFCPLARPSHTAGCQGEPQMQRSSWGRLLAWGIVGGMVAPAVVISVLVNRSTRRRVGRILLGVRNRLADQRDDLFGEFTLEEFLTGRMARRPRR